MRRRDYRVSLVVPDGVTDGEMRRYIDEAVSTWKGQMHPDEPLFALKGDTVRVTKIRKPKPKPSMQPQYQGD